MEQYKASNGITLTDKGDNSTYRVFVGGWGITAKEVDALREFFRAEEDERLGRWRWPENTDYVVYPVGEEIVDVLREASVSKTTRGPGRQESITRAKAAEWDRDYSQNFFGAARAYFDAHPEPKPWHGAKVGDVWVIRLRGDDYETACLVESFDDTRVFQMPDAESITTTRDIVETARRIWPEDAS